MKLTQKLLVGTALLASLYSNPALAQNTLVEAQPEPDKEETIDGKIPSEQALDKQKKEIEQHEREINVLFTHAQIVANNQKPISRSEVLITDLPYDADAYVIYEQQGRSKFTKVRAQTIPFNISDLKLGLSAQYVKASGSKSHEEIGLVGRITGPVGNSFGKLDVRWFPSQESIDSYGFITNTKMYLDLLAIYDCQSKYKIIRPGIDFKVNENVSVGIEAKFSGVKLNKDYLGIRGKINF